MEHNLSFLRDQKKEQNNFIFLGVEEKKNFFCNKMIKMSYLFLRPFVRVIHIERARELSKEFAMLSSVVPNMFKPNVKVHKKPLITSVAQLCRVFENSAIEYVIGGGMALAAHGYARATCECNINVFVCLAAQLLRALAGLRVQLPKDLNNLSLGPCDQFLKNNELLQHIENEFEKGWFTLWIEDVQFDIHVPCHKLQETARQQAVDFPLALDCGKEICVKVHSFSMLCCFELTHFQLKNQANLSELFRARVLVGEPIDWDGLSACVCRELKQFDVESRLAFLKECQKNTYVSNRREMM